MASHIYMQNLDEISQVTFSVRYGKILKNVIGHTLRTSYMHMPNLNLIHYGILEILSG